MKTKLMNNVFCVLKAWSR